MVVIGRVEILNLSNYLHVSNLFNLLVFDKLFHYVSWVVLPANVMLSSCIKEFLGQGSPIDRHLISSTDQVLPVFQHMN